MASYSWQRSLWCITEIASVFIDPTVCCYIRQFVNILCTFRVPLKGLKYVLVQAYRKCPRCVKKTFDMLQGQNKVLQGYLYLSIWSLLIVNKTKAFTVYLRHSMCYRDHFGIQLATEAFSLSQWQKNVIAISVCVKETYMCVCHCYTYCKTVTMTSNV